MKKKICVLAVDLVLLLIGLFAKSIVYYFSSIIPICPTKAIGFLCPACGGTRCVFYFFQGDFAAAFSLNALIFLTGIYAIIVLIIWNLSWLFRVRFAEKSLKYLLDYRVFIAWSVGMAVFTAIRNII